MDNIDLSTEKCYNYKKKGGFEVNYLKIKVKSDNLRKMREKERLSQGEFAELLNLSRWSIIKYEKNKMNPSKKAARRICELFGVKFSELFYYEKEG